MRVSPQPCSLLPLRSVQLVGGWGGSLSSAVFFLLNQLRRDYTFLEDVSTIIGKFQPAFSFFFFSFFHLFLGRTFCQLYKHRRIAFEKRDPLLARPIQVAKCMTDSKYI